MKVIESQIANFYSNLSIFITGGTGFLGKVIIEKLLRSCPNLKTIYVLIRSKNGVDFSTRIKTLREDNVFEILQATNPLVLEKLKGIPGDVTQNRLGIGAEDWELLRQEVTVIIHAAATVKFDENLKIAANMNVKGTQRVIELCQALEEIRAFVHVSTAYSNCDKPEIKEVIYPLPMSVQQLLDKIDSMTKEEEEEMTKVLIYGKPNTYTYTKAMAENILKEHAGVLPISIVRPSIGAWNEPKPGWLCGMNGPAGLVAAWGKGFLRTVFCDKSKVADCIPVDICANLILAAAYKSGTLGTRGITVYNCCSGTLNPITWGQIEDYTNLLLAAHPSKRAVRTPNCDFTTSGTKHVVRGFLTEAVPARVSHIANRLQGKKIRILKLYNLMNAAVKSMEFFTMNGWNFAIDNMNKLYGELSDEDKILFNLDVKVINWQEHVEDSGMEFSGSYSKKHKTKV